MKIKFYEQFIRNMELENKIKFNPYYPEICGIDENGIKINSEYFIDLASNNYLGLASDNRVIEEVIKVIKKYGVSQTATPITVGHSKLYKNVSKRLAEFCGVADTLIFPSCYQANIGLFSMIAGKKDIIFIDHYAHSSLIEGTRKTKAKIRPFLHNDYNSLEKMLIKSEKYENKIIVTESVFSTEGSIAPLDKYNYLSLKYNAVLIVDDSHGIGVLGENGRGILNHFNLKKFNGIYTASLGKALANSGGLIGGNQKFIDYLKYYCSALVYSTSISPSVLAGINKVLDILEKEYSSLYKKMMNNKFLITEKLLMKNFSVNKSVTPIVSVQTGKEEDTIEFAKYLYENKIFSTPFIYPSVPKNRGVVRLIPNAGLKTKNIKFVCECIERFK